MTTEILKLALDALEEPKEHFAKHRRLEAITAIKEFLAQPEPEYIAFMDTPQRKPLTGQMTKQMRESCDSYEMRGAFVDGWLSAEAAHGIKGGV